jgi:hypothetical protein
MPSLTTDLQEKEIDYLLNFALSLEEAVRDGI